jgi:hypothetical protein
VKIRWRPIAASRDTSCGVQVLEELVITDAAGQARVIADEPLTIDREGRVTVGAPSANAVARVERGRVRAIRRCVIGGQPLEEHRERLLVGACSIDVGTRSLRVEVRPCDDASTRRLALALVADGTELRVLVVEGPDVGRDVALVPGRELLVGRASACELSLTDPGTSREHLAVSVAGDDVLVRDLGSSGGTSLGGVRLEPRRSARWPPDRMVALGNSVLALRVPAAAVVRALEQEIAEAPRADRPLDGEPAARVHEPSTETALTSGPTSNVHPSSPTSSPANATAAPVALVPPRGRAPSSNERTSSKPTIAFVAIALVGILALAGLIYVLLA